MSISHKYPHKVLFLSFKQVKVASIDITNLNYFHETRKHFYNFNWNDGLRFNRRYSQLAIRYFAYSLFKVVLGEFKCLF
jgi:hypothetical protein